MEVNQIYIISTVVIVIILVSSIIYTVNQNRLKKQRKSAKEKKPANKRDNFRLRVNIKDSVMEIIKIGNKDITEYDYCEIMDLSAGGAGIVSYYDLPLKKTVYVRVQFFLNDEEFILNGRVVRKSERINRSSYFYGIQFLNLSKYDENRLMKEIVALENRRRKMAIK
jgi:c-di-GMP-binding flagellar brake protein YcgR